MKLLLFLLLSSVAFAIPPLADVQDYNSNLGNYLENNYNSTSAESNSLTLYGQSLEVFTSVDIVGPTITVDNLTHPSNDISILFARGTFIQHLSDGSQSTCNSDYHPVPSCDLDNDDCPEFEINSSISYLADAIFTFQNLSISVPFSSTVIEVPEEIKEKMESASGLDSLDVSISGDVVFTYVINNNEFDGLQCTDNIENMSVSVPISFNESFLVAGKKKLFFLRAPILLEQWASNNHFDVILLSQSPIYYAELSINNQSVNFTLKNFSVISGPYGFEQILSDDFYFSNIGEYGPNLSTPTLLQEENNSFAYVYEFNFTYSGVGKNNLSILVTDVFLESAEYNETILSRTLSEKDSEFSRPSVPNQFEVLNNIQLSLGFIVLVVFLAFIYFWATR